MAEPLEAQQVLREMRKLHVQCKAKMQWLQERMPVMEEKARQIGIGNVTAL